MSAVKLIFKRSSVLGKRPTSANLDPGEIGLNTNAVNPGLFFETTDGNVIKVGPTSVLPVAPTGFPEKGELWYNTEAGTVNIGVVKNSEKAWQEISSPYLGGSPNVVFVAPEFPGSNDSITNNGRTLPYQTLTRAILELSKIRIQRAIAGASDAGESNRYTIFVAPSRITANNGPGVALADFDVDFSDQGTTNPSIDQLQKFNAIDGGLIVPAGISIVAMDLKKCEVKPTYIPTYKHPALSPAAAGANEPLSCIFKWSGNAYVSNFSISDKVDVRDIVDITKAPGDNPSAVFRSSRPHGLQYNDLVTVTLAPNVPQSSKLPSGQYYVAPIDTFTFYLTTQDQSNNLAVTEFVEYADVPNVAYSGIKFIVTNELYSAHRLAAFANASEAELSEYYTKVQAAFPTYFGDAITQGIDIVSSGEYVIVGPTDDRRPDTTAANTTRNSSAYLNQVNVRSQYGMCGGDFDGSVVEGFRSVIINASTVISLQNDPVAYEIYTTLYNSDTGNIEQKWWKLLDAAYYSRPITNRPAAKFAISRQEQLDLLNSTQVENVRYYYETEVTPTGFSTGITNIEYDFRNFGFRFRNPSFGQLQSVYTIGCAVGVWALNGGQIALTNSTSNFGSISFLSEGFAGINSLGGAQNNQKGFLLEGFQVPLALLYSQATDDANKQILSLGGRIVSITPDPDNDTIQRINLNAQFSPRYILPYSLAGGSAVWVTDGTNTYRAFFANDGGPTVILNPTDPTIYASLRVRIGDSNIPTDPATFPYLGVPFIRRFIDPRNELESSYSFVFQNSSPIGVAPELYSVLRLNQNSDAVNAGTIRPNVQFDPGETGGWGRIFSVAKCTPAALAESPQFNYSIFDPQQDNRYYINIHETDVSRPWNQVINNSTGQAATYGYRNWYAAENNYWYNVYYDVIFENDTGPLKVPPVDTNSPFVPAATLIRQEPVTSSYQGAYGADPDTPIYPDDATYLRGYTIPYTASKPTNILNGDDGTPSMGLCIHDVYSGKFTQTTQIVDRLARIQTQQLPGDLYRYKPNIFRFDVLSTVDIPNPKQELSILRFTDATGSKIQYFRVIAINGTTLDAIGLNAENSFYPNPTDLQPDWPSGTTVQIMSLNETPVPRAYDPLWGVTKRSVLRFLDVMGYPVEDIFTLLQPQYWGERFVPVEAIPVAPNVNGYALTTSRWPCEFNTPSSVVANTHTWAYSGYYNYSIGLPIYQNAVLPRKLTADYQCYALWSGRLAVSGVDENGEFFQFGPQFQATTSRFYQQPDPVVNRPNQQIYSYQSVTELPGQVSVFYTDNISSLFNSETVTFPLTRSGMAVPPELLLADSMFVQFNGNVLVPGVDYTVSESSITFTSAPRYGVDCQIRVISSGDNQKTLVSYSHVFVEPQDGTRTVFTVNDSSLVNLYCERHNTFVFVNGVELESCNKYFVTRLNSTTIQFTFTEAPEPDAVIDARTFTTGDYWAKRGCSPVAVYDLDKLDSQFNGATKDFTLAYNGVEINPLVATPFNLIVGLNSKVLVPGVDYTVDKFKVIFTEAPAAGSAAVLRIITNAESLSCPNLLGSVNGFLRWGPSVVLDLATSSDSFDFESIT